MKPSSFFKPSRRWLNVPTLSLLALLQRTPVAPVARSVGEFVLASPVAAMLRSAAVLAGSLGAMNSMAGATPLVPSIGSAAGLSATVGTAVSVAFTVTPTQTPIQSWNIGGTVPPGLNFSGRTSAGSVDVGSLLLHGTPTTAGTYAVTLQAFDGTGNTGYVSAIYPYTITVTGMAMPPAFTTQPAGQTVTVGANVTFSAMATGTPAPTYQWRKDGTAIGGATDASLSLTGVQLADAGSYTVVATNSAGPVTSAAAVLTVNPPAPVASSAPAQAGAFASGPTEVTLSWQPPATDNGSAITGYKIERAADSAFGAGLVAFDLGAATSYVDTTATAGATFYYRVSAINAGGASAPSATLTVKTPATPGSGASPLVNIATRAYCGTGDSVTIGGFVIGGSEPKKVLVRAVGPTLTSQGVAASEVLADPKIEVHDTLHGNAVIATNDNWGENDNPAEITQVAGDVGAAALTTEDTTTAALVLTLKPGVYSFVASGQGGTSGIVLMEIYDADIGGADAKLVNIATRAFCKTGNGVTIGGFVISGHASKRVLVRAVGPTLATQNIDQADALADPVIELHDALHGNVVVATNDNWTTNANADDIVTTGAPIGATPFADSADTVVDHTSSALLLTMPPGVYSFVVTGRGATQGIVLLEVYDAD
jgi:hypothetical protein